MLIRSIQERTQKRRFIHFLRKIRATVSEFSQQQRGSLMGIENTIC